ncbi:MAG: SRPBCC family protein [Pseudomonadota bacterium]
MRYQLDLEINAPRDRVVELFLDTDNLKHWQPSLVRFEMINCDAFRGVGAQSRQLHRMGKREVEMIATITVENHPDEFSATYEAEDMWNLIENRFEEFGDSTRWSLVSECRSSSWFMKVLMLLFPGMFKKQTMEFMQYFKSFVESRTVGE